MNVWKMISLNCGETYESMIDHRSYAHNLSSCSTAMINHKFISFSAVQIYDLSCIHLQDKFFLSKKIVDTCPPERTSVWRFIEGPCLLSMTFLPSRYAQDFFAKEIQIRYDKHHKVSSLVKRHQTTLNSVKYEVI